ncbi:vacuolar ATP synthase subunit S1-domain-containing protein [Lentinula aff. lateritia]|uniref:Vacuolar ATP synthase subunit S1-domain-containing protein n=1 Tax=Lentinula aff. lateritia TaxID=2804960 RepID=A0ACC1U8B7_9AGAR|nr:vacuolar ATP synthase subunit S1-domain-containing protein [Lentinula aff. lateritia]
MSRLTLLSLLVFSPLALAFSNTAPLLAWSSRSSNFIDRLPPSSSSVSGTLQPKNVFETMLMNDDVCDHEAVILVHQPGLHASDLRQLSKTSHIARSISSASSSRQYAYVPAMYTSGKDEDHLEFAQSVSQKCHARLVNILAGQGGDVDFQASGQKSVVVVNLPGVEGSQSKSRANGMAEHDVLLSTTLDALPFSNRVVIYTVLDLTENEAASSSPSIIAKKNKGGILHNYQLLTPGLIMVLLVVLFILLPVLYFGISAMASIQSPLRLDSMPKGYNANERKNQ